MWCPSLSLRCCVQHQDCPLPPFKPKISWSLDFFGGRRGVRNRFNSSYDVLDSILYRNCSVNVASYWERRDGEVGRQRSLYKLSCIDKKQFTFIFQKSISMNYFLGPRHKFIQSSSESHVKVWSSLTFCLSYWKHLQQCWAKC